MEAIIAERLKLSKDDVKNLGRRFFNRIRERIFPQTGTPMNLDGSRRVQLSTEPISVSIKKPFGDPVNPRPRPARGATYEPGKDSIYFLGGYRQYKDTAGTYAGHKLRGEPDWILTGRLRKDFRVSPETTEKMLIYDFVDRQRALTTSRRIVRQLTSGPVRYDDVLGLTSNELRRMALAVRVMLLRKLRA